MTVVDAREAERRRQTEYQSGAQRQSEREDQYPGIDRDLVRARKDGLAERAKGVSELAGYVNDPCIAHQPDAPIREHGARDTTGHGQHEAFGDELTEHASPRGAEGPADGNLAPTSDAADQQQVGDVGADDEKHYRNRDNEQPERRRNRRHLLINRTNNLETRLLARWGRRRCSQPGAERLHFDVRLLD